MSYQYIDIGVNLMGKQFHSDRDDIVKDSVAHGVGMIVTGTDMKSDKAAMDYIKKEKVQGLWCTCGIHPHNADGWNETCKERFVKMIRQNKDIVVALGEVGLDYDRMFSTKENQKKCFSDILNIAEEMKLPLFLHERLAQADFTNLMKKHRDICKRSVVHCFTGTRDAAYGYLQLGCYIGITGWVCDSRRNKEVVEAVKMIPLERLMVETDAPYLTPRNQKGLSSRNVPVNVKYVVEMIAQIKNVDVEIVRKAALENTIKFFDLSVEK
ncbi:MAG: TatD family hydrolase [Lachnospiraceae bacterium]|nr:TatD family hydrolase [Lachnospiraceae bacterium]